MYGLAATCPGQTASIFSQPALVWDYILHGCPTSIGTPPAPTGDVLTVPPASGADAQATVDALLAAQLKAQQAANAAGVTSSPLDVVEGGVASATDSLVSWGDSFISGGIPMWVWLLGGVAVFGLVAFSGGSPRRYGR